MHEHILEMKSISKSFAGVQALHNVAFNVTKNEIHALVGENGAGKSTLMNILGGIYSYGSYSGEVCFEGEECKFKDVNDSEKLGIAVIHQELALVPYLTIAENMFLGNEQARRGVIDWDLTRSKAQSLLKKLGLHDSPETAVQNIGVGKQQLVEIAKALAKDVKLLILDEPTAALNENDSQRLLDILLGLKSHGVTAVIISHKLQEILQIADTITILRDGTVVETLVQGKDNITEDKIIKGMVGRELVDRFPSRTPQIGETIFSVKNWNVHDPLDEERKVIDNVSFHVKKGEIVGIAGLIGAGRTELAMSIFGRSFGKKISGTITKNGKIIHPNTVSDAISCGIAYTVEDRKTTGLVLNDDIRHNISLAGLEKISFKGIVNPNKEIQIAEEYKRKLLIKSSSVFQLAKELSGGNQQKIVLSKWIFTEPDLFILDEPTRGIDVGAKYEIYSIMNKLVSEGKSIIFISSELLEILGVSDRIYVMNEGGIVGELPKEKASSEAIMRCIVRNIRGTE